MKTERGASQVLFGMLPTQTVDLQGHVWKVSHWADPVKLVLDQTSVRNAVLEAIAPWAATGQDGGLAAELYGRASIEVVGVNPDRGVIVEPFPRQWRCRRCNRISTEQVERCKCGAQHPAQMQFVAYHDCGRLREPRLPRCTTHHAVAVRLPGTAASRELYFYCPDCSKKLSTGFPFQQCECGTGPMKYNVHRASVVFSPQYAVLVNPPDPAVAARLRASGGGARALEWVLDGMGPTIPSDDSQTVEGLIEMLMQSNLSAETARLLAQQALERGEVRQGAAKAEIQLPDTTRQRAQEEALSLTSATTGGRVLISNMVEGTTPPLRTLYELGYLSALDEARLSSVELLTNFPVATLAIGFTRGDAIPGQAALVSFRERGGIRTYGVLNRTEALLFQLDPLAVYEYLITRGFALDQAKTPREARLAILASVEIPRPTDQQPQPLGKAIITLLHSYVHRTIRALAVEAGVERDGLSEYLLPHSLSFIVYAAARSEFVLGGLQAVFETSLERVLDAVVYGEVRCPLDPGCRSGGGACMACLHLGEPSCRWFNRFLDRASLFDERGYLRGPSRG